MNKLFKYKFISRGPTLITCGPLRFEDTNLNDGASIQRFINDRVSGTAPVRSYYPS